MPPNDGRVWSVCGLFVVCHSGTVLSMSRLERITSDPSICHGKPTVRGLRYPVENLLELLAGGMTVDEVLEDHPDLEREDLTAVLESEPPPHLRAP